MKAFFLSIIYVFCSCSLFFIGRGVDGIDIMSERYKRALDAGANAAAGYRAYNTKEMLQNQGSGYGLGLEDSLNVEMDREEALKWFYRLFFRNLGIVDKDRQRELKAYIPMKALILYDRLMIADASDQWSTYTPVGEKKYIISYKGRQYCFTLSDQVYDIGSSKWIAAGDIGLEPEARRKLITEYISDELEGFLRGSGITQSGSCYDIVFSINDTDKDKLSSINGVNFLVLCEGLPVPSMNPFRRKGFYAYSLGGSEILR